MVLNNGLSIHQKHGPHHLGTSLVDSRKHQNFVYYKQYYYSKIYQEKEIRRQGWVELGT